MHLLGRRLWREGSAEVVASGRGMGTGHEEENSKQKRIPSRRRTIWALLYHLH